MNLLLRTLTAALLTLSLAACQATAPLASASPGASSPEALGEQFIAFYDAGDIDGLMTLYEDGAVFTTRSAVHTGSDDVRAVLQNYLDSGLKLDFHEKVSFVSGEIALVQNRWTVRGTENGGVTVEVARQQPDGTWKYVIDSPDGEELVR
ncbi:YybH family protein [Rubrivirga sp.]|uniref:YybH family protein n=1 Tax=Rubrivirga sp. TaxID=1885344 RepID=UPI003C769137